MTSLAGIKVDVDASTVPPEMIERTITIPVKPQPKERNTTLVMKGGKARTLKSKKTRVFEQVARLNGQVAMRGAAPSSAQLDVSLFIHAESVEVTIRERPMRIKRATRGDVDNIAKAVLDGLNGVAWEDDRQIVSLCIFDCGRSK